MNETKVNKYTGIIVIGIILWIISLFFGNSGHESDIKKAQIAKAENMGMNVRSISVEYLGNSEYKCVSDIYDPGTAYSSPQNIHNIVIYKWEDDNYTFIRNE